MSQSQSMPDMYILRVHFRNGTLSYWAYLDMGRANDALKVVAKAKVTGSMPHPQAQQAHCNFIDDAERDVYLNGADIMFVQLVNLREEITMETRLMVYGQRLKDHLTQMSAEPDQPVHMHQNAIGVRTGNIGETVIPIRPGNTFAT